MPNPEQFHPPKVLQRFGERRATNRAKHDFDLWQKDHPMEAQILTQLDTELKHQPYLQNPRRAQLCVAARQQRRELGFGDHLAKYVYELPFRLEGMVAQEGTVLPEEELRLLKEVNHGFWARVGIFSSGVRRLDRLTPR